jgi:methylmalonyl-CoA mutase N-terminal domain/subunit
MRCCGSSRRICSVGADATERRARLLPETTIGRSGERLVPAASEPLHPQHDGSYPIIGVNTFRSKHSDAVPPKLELARSTEEEKQSQLKRLSEFHARNAREAPKALERLKRVVIENGNVFAELMKTVRVCSLGQITKALFEVGGEYRRSM